MQCLGTNVSRPSRLTLRGWSAITFALNIAAIRFVLDRAAAFVRDASQVTRKRSRSIIRLMQPKPARLSPAKYIEWEMKSSVKLQYVDGEVYAMSGASRRHNLIVGNLLRRALNAAAEHKHCQVFGSDMRVQVD